MKSENLKNIRTIFEAGTGTELSNTVHGKKPLITVLIAACLVCLMTVTAFAAGIFNSLEGDDLALSSSYEGSGIVNLTVENRSDKELQLQPKLYLRLWSSGEDVPKLSGDVIFTDNAPIPAHSSSTIKIDLSKAYDVERLEKPLSADNYYFVLTNSNFLFGHDWICTVKFIEEPSENMDEGKHDVVIASAINALLRFYYETFPDRATGELVGLHQEYIEKYEALLDEFEGTVVSPIKPSHGSMYVGGHVPEPPNAGLVFYDTAEPTAEQAELWGAGDTVFDVNMKLLGKDGEYGEKIYIRLPDPTYPGAFIEIPVIYLLVYNKEEALPENYAFIRGQVIGFDELQELAVFDDGKFICYNISEFVYSDLNDYINCAVSYYGQNLSQEDMDFLHETYEYLKNKLPEMIMYLDEYKILTD